MKFRRPSKPLNGKTPNWFKEWHDIYFRPSDARSKRNERWLIIIITALIGASVLNGDSEEITAFLLRVFNG
ncbi:hypothetical protein LCGC14_1400630 [marine sediment metagenome]|uniref:Uncharacterized protein n=1 Tax=marine sediment metagenome TaxID=412755 RepID=A0A0F9MYS2_9ZZZZ